jgi:succinate-acetate transporter protein
MVMETTDKKKKIAKRIAAFVILWVVFTVVMMIILLLGGKNMGIIDIIKYILLSEILGLAVAGIFYLTIKKLFDWIKDDE